jgi:hypothetical protein
MPTNSTLEHSINYLAREAQFAQTRDEHENFSIALRLLGLIYDGWNPTPSLFDVACGYVVGLVSAKYIYRKARRLAHERRELLRAIPDYDYSTETLSDDDPTDGRRHYGNQFLRMAIEIGPKHDAITACGARENDAAADWKTGERADSDDRYSVSAGARVGDLAGRTVDPGRRPAKRVNSNAQLQRITQTIDQAAYFGA